MNKGYKQILLVLLCGLPFGLIVYALGGGANFIIPAAVLPILGYLFLAAVGISCVAVEDRAAPKSTVILSWAMTLVIALGIFLLFNLSASAVSLLVMIALLIYIYSNVYGRHVTKEETGNSDSSSNR